MSFLAPYVEFAQILLAVALIAVVLLQSRGSGFSSTFSSDSSIYRTRRGIERLLFQFTIGLAVVFILISLASAKLAAS
ncbi:MAG TPA: preprotein translocase subunit SecG [Chloroflexota bacterium]|nr:preprotein translocase subunit SecG [Chloroflexota bacterium]